MAGDEEREINADAAIDLDVDLTADQHLKLVELESKALLEHAGRAWTSAEENSRRLSLRVNLLLTTLVVLVAGTIFKLTVDPLIGLRSYWSGRLTLLVLGVGLLLFSVAIGLLLGLPKLGRSKQEVADEARLNPFAGDAFLRMHQRIDKEELNVGTYRLLACRACFSDTMDAATDLQARNDDERGRVNTAQQYYLLGLLCLLGAFVIYTSAVLRQADSNRSVLDEEVLHEQSPR